MSESEERYPRLGQVVTVIAVRNLQAAVLGATVTSVTEGRYELHVEEVERLSSAPVAPGGRVKLLYGSGPMVWRLAGSVLEVGADDGVLTVHCPDAPRPGERREFIRAEMVLTLFARRLEAKDLGAAASEASDLELPDDDPRWKVQLVDLSGSGIKLRLDEETAPEDIVELRLRLQDRPQKTTDLFGRVVRCVPLDGGGYETALRFEQLTEVQQDALINTAFRVRYEQLG